MWLNLKPDDLTFVQTHVSACNYFLPGLQSTGNFGQPVILLPCLHSLFAGDVLVIFLLWRRVQNYLCYQFGLRSAAVQ